MCLRFVFFLVMQLAVSLRLSRREEAWKTAETLILRGRPAVLQRGSRVTPKLNWADRALLATLPSVIAKARRHRVQLLVTPDPILRWHRDIVRRRWAPRSLRGSTGRPATRRNIKAMVLRLVRGNTEWRTSEFARFRSRGRPEHPDLHDSRTDRDGRRPRATGWRDGLSDRPCSATSEPGTAASEEARHFAGA
jgi:hypothetical protein